MPKNPPITSDSRQKQTLPNTTPAEPVAPVPPSLDFPGRTLMRLDEVAAKLGVTPVHISHLIVGGKLQAIDLRSPGSPRAVYRVPLEAYRDYLVHSATSAEERVRLMRELPRATLIHLHSELNAVLASLPAGEPSA